MKRIAVRSRLLHASVHGSRAPPAASPFAYSLIRSRRPADAGRISPQFLRAGKGLTAGRVSALSERLLRLPFPVFFCTPRFMHLLLKVSRLLLHRSYLKRYLQLQAGTREQIEAWQVPLAAARAWRVNVRP